MENGQTVNPKLVAKAAKKLARSGEISKSDALALLRKLFKYKENVPPERMERTIKESLNPGETEKLIGFYKVLIGKQQPEKIENGVSEIERLTKKLLDPSNPDFKRDFARIATLCGEEGLTVDIGSEIGEGLEKEKNQKVFDYLLESTNSEDMAIRRLAYLSLPGGIINDEEFKSYVLKGLSDPNEVIREEFSNRVGLNIEKFYPEFLELACSSIVNPETELDAVDAMSYLFWRLVSIQTEKGREGFESVLPFLSRVGKGMDRLDGVREYIVDTSDFMEKNDLNNTLAVFFSYDKETDFRSHAIEQLASQNALKRYVAHKLLWGIGDRTGLVDDLPLSLEEKIEATAMLGPRLHPLMEKAVREQSLMYAYYLAGLSSRYSLKEVSALAERVNKEDKMKLIGNLWNLSKDKVDLRLGGIGKAFDYYGSYNENLFEAAKLFSDRLKAEEYDKENPLTVYKFFLNIDEESLRKIEQVTDVRNAFRIFWLMDAYPLETILDFLKQKPREMHKVALDSADRIGISETDEVIQKFKNPLPILKGLLEAKTNFLKVQKKPEDLEYERIASIIEPLQDKEKGRALDIVSARGYEALTELEKYNGVYRRLALYAIEESVKMDDVLKLSEDNARIVLKEVVRLVGCRDNIAEGEYDGERAKYNGLIKEVFEKPGESLESLSKMKAEIIESYKRSLCSFKLTITKPHELEAGISLFGELVSEEHAEGKEEAKKLAEARNKLKHGGGVSRKEILAIASSLKKYSTGLEKMLEKEEYNRKELVELKHFLEKQKNRLQLRDHVKLFNAQFITNDIYDANRVKFGVAEFGLYLGVEEIEKLMDDGVMDIRRTHERFLNVDGYTNLHSSRFAYIRSYLGEEKAVVANSQREFEGMPARLRKLTEDVGIVLLLEVESYAGKMGLKSIEIPTPEAYMGLWNIHFHPRTALEFYVRAPRKLGYELKETMPGSFLTKEEGLQSFMVWEKKITEPSELIKGYEKTR